ncbi:riboflavin transporter 2-like [Athalia rosae]|uniref:riboflavin transporter 2-like n=1 Tax=Athalia rosae TaxID=37344 RepID=UPI0020339DE5|nr:riboflavin transporter 2-like [Athalia rosae]
MFPALYVLLKKFVPRYCNEFIWISGLLVIGFVSMGFLALFHDVTWTFNGRDHSVVMLIIVFISSVVNSSSSIIFMPYLRNFDKKYLTSYYLGEGLSGTVPSIIALFQGVGGDSSCKTEAPLSNEPHIVNAPKPNFPPSIYFLILSILLVFCASAFWLLEYLRGRMVLEEGCNVRCYGQVPLTDDVTCTANKPPDHDSKVNACEIDELQISSSVKTNGYTKNYLCVLIGLTCFVAHGILPGTQAYSCLPYGNAAYHLVATLTQFAGPVAYILGYCLPPLGVRGVTWISVHALLLSTYITWLAISSPNPLWRDEIYGIVLLVTAWTLSFALISYMKLSIAAISQQSLAPDSLYHIGISNRIGTVFGAIVSFVIVNYTTIFTAYSGC